LHKYSPHLHSSHRDAGWKNHQRLHSVVKFTPRYTEEPHKFALRHGNFAIPLATNLHSISPVEITALIGYAYFSFGIIDCLHAVSSSLSIPNESSKFATWKK
jgi:membrane protein DedA with SNARE-associated domain